MEIQVQTRNQFRWQQTAERAAGYDVAIKYGGGHPAVAQACGICPRWRGGAIFPARISPNQPRALLTL